MTQSKYQLIVNKFRHQSTMKLTIVMFSAMVLVSCARTQERNIEGFAIEAFNGIILTRYTSAEKGDQELKAKAAFIYTLLFNTAELNTHRMNGEVDNQVFIHDSGAEAVYDKDGIIVKNCENMGSYNYAHYKKEPLLHFSVDILPWLRWGNCREDSTTVEQRVNAYIMDIAEALDISSAADTDYFLPENYTFENSAQNLSIAFFLKALEQSSFDLQDFIFNDQADESSRKQFLQHLDSGFVSILEARNK